ncbi:MAG: hypothetical protein SFZ23_15455 [Planctomycetota bacterium]|nr:hypothetical protein [Planctomycetota bacterium]
MDSLPGLVFLALLGLLLAPLGVAIARVGAGVASGVGFESGGPLQIEWPALARTLAVGAVVGIGATLVAVPLAWAVRRRGWSAGAWLLVVPILPSYLTFAGWGVVRDPGTWLGDAVADLAQGEPWRWLPAALGTTLAILAMVLWAAPLASLILVASLRGVSDAAFDALRLEARPTLTGRMRYRATQLGLMGQALAVSAGAAALVAMGSAVPLHLAQIKTVGLRAWIELDQRPLETQWVAATRCWPLLVVAAIAAAVVVRAIRRASPDSGDEVTGSRLGPGRWVGVFLVVSVGVPLGLLVSEAGGVGHVRLMGSLHADAIGGSLGVAMATGVCGAAIAAGCARWALVRGWLGWGVRLLMGVLVAAALSPGVVIGWAYAWAWSGFDAPEALRESIAPVVGAHVARFGALAAAIGAWVALTEPRALAEMIRLDGASGWRGWLGAVVPRQLPALVGAGLLVAALSFQEIESAVMVQPAGVQSFPRVVLAHLHFFRTRDLAACAAWATLIGGGFAAIGVGLIGLSRARGRGATRAR